MPGARTEETDAGASPDAARDPRAGTTVAERPYAVKTPSGYDGSAPLPLLLSLHGYGGTAAFQETYFKLDALVEAKGFLLAMPEGLQDQLGYRYWNATDACCDWFTSGVDDVAYLKAVIADMKRRYDVDPKRVFVVGHSNGGFMAHRLACEDAAEVAAVVSLAGEVYRDTWRCQPSEPVAVLQVQGDADEIVPYGGGVILQFHPSAPGAQTTVATWAAKNGCDAALAPTGTQLDLDAQLDGAETTIARHACAKGAAELWTIAGGKHIPSFTDAWGPSFWDFLAAHPKP